MRILIVTVAGMSSRFSESLGHPCLKCLYYENGIEDSLLYNMLHQDGEFDYYVIVGGFMYNTLKAALDNDFICLKEKIILVKNEHYADYGSGYSLYLALQQIQGMNFDEVIFAEGDLFVDRESFRKICDNTTNVITCNTEPIVASKAVAFYFDRDYGIHYIYDTDHSILEIKEPFQGIYNSGQIWKFADADRLKKMMKRIPEKAWEGTNLVLIQEYFGPLTKNEYDIVTFRKWVNCNTIYDYKKCDMRGDTK
ncbi:MAG: hypothetical protein K2N73_07795 [Lachnospiraceae bacterium]|nr:hypothetical protein [Lachnospiraceae bacterium]